VTDLRATIEAVRREGRQRNARCPAHDDRRASLSVSLGDNGRLLLRCHGGCETTSVLSAGGLEWRDVMPLEPRNGEPATVTRYEIRDLDNRLVALHERRDDRDGKRFIWLRPDGAAGLNGRRTADLPLYDVHRLHDVPADALVVVVEGERACDALRARGIAAVGTITGANGTPSDDVLRPLLARPVVLWPDADTPGRAHMARIAARLAALGHANVRSVHWAAAPPHGDAADYSGDPRRLIDAARSASPSPADAVESRVVARTLAEVEATFARWIRDDDPIPTRAVLAAYVANRMLDGDPIWLMVVGGSGVGKTERLIPLAVMPDVVLESSITGPAALLSGTGRKDRAKDATGGLLRKLPDGGGVLLLKDFTSIIDMHRDARAEVLAALREVYDGRWDRSVGAEGGRTLTWTGHVGLIAGCTTAIDSAHGVLSIMGTRFLLVRLESGQDIAGSAFDHVGSEPTMRAELCAATRGLLDHLPGAPYDKAEVRTPVIALGQYVARARSPVKRDQRSDIELVLDPEAPTRIVKMLVQLWRACGLLGLDRTQSWALVSRVGLDSIPKLRRAVLDHLARCPTPETTTDVAEAVEHPAQTTRRALEDLTAHRVTLRLPGGPGKADRWDLSPLARQWLEHLTFPVSSEWVQSPAEKTSTSAPLIRPQIPNDDKTGKVGFQGTTEVLDL
jgi:hypothetical protein